MAMMRQLKPGIDYDAWTIKEEDGTLNPNAGTGATTNSVAAGDNWVRVWVVEAPSNWDAWTIKKEDGTLSPNTTGDNMDGKWASMGGKWVSVKLIEVK